MLVFLGMIALELAVVAVIIAALDALCVAPKKKKKTGKTLQTRPSEVKQTRPKSAPIPISHSTNQVHSVCSLCQKEKT